jgi:hypothetical protein
MFQFCQKNKINISIIQKKKSINIHYFEKEIFVSGPKNIFCYLVLSYFVCFLVSSLITRTFTRNQGRMQV